MKTTLHDIARRTVETPTEIIIKVQVTSGLCKDSRNVFLDVGEWEELKAAVDQAYATTNTAELALKKLEQQTRIKNGKRLRSGYVYVSQDATGAFRLGRSSSTPAQPIVLSIKTDDTAWLEGCLREAYVACQTSTNTFNFTDKDLADLKSTVELDRYVVQK